MTGDAVVPHVISNWQAFKVTLWSKAVMYSTNSCRLDFSLFHSNISSAVVKTRSWREWGHIINILCFHVCFHSFTLKLCFSFWSPSHLFLIAASYLSQPRLHLLFHVKTQSASSLYYHHYPLVLLLWHYFPSRGLRPAVAVWFELFQVFLQQQGEIVMVLAGCVCTNRWGMRITEQRVMKCWRLTKIYILDLWCK